MDGSRQPVYLCVDNASVVYVSSSPSFSYASFRLYVGVLGSALREIAVLDVRRLRDGGTTYVQTDEGTFHSPARRRFPRGEEDRYPRTSFWRVEGSSPRELTEVDPDCYTISDDGDTVIVVPASNATPSPGEA